MTKLRKDSAARFRFFIKGHCNVQGEFLSVIEFDNYGVSFLYLSSSFFLYFFISLFMCVHIFKREIKKSHF